jgi:hypothetical protein
MGPALYTFPFSGYRLFSVMHTKYKYNIKHMGHELYTFPFSGYRLLSVMHTIYKQCNENE